MTRTTGDMQRFAAYTAAQEAAKIDAFKAGVFSRWQAVQPQLRAATIRALTGDVTAMNEARRLLGYVHELTIEAIDPMIRGIGGYAEWKRRKVCVPVIKASDSFKERCEKWATTLHEIGHVVGHEPCKGPRHRRDTQVKDYHICAECERIAWATAMRLAPFNKEMFADLRSHAQWLREQTPAMEAVAYDTERMMGTAFLAEHRLEWIRNNDRLDRLERLERGR